MYRSSSRLRLCLSLHLPPCFSTLSFPPYCPLFYPSSYFLSRQLSEGHQGYYLDMRYTMSAFPLPPASLTHSTPHLCCPLLLYQVFGVLISGHLGCRVTDGPVGIKWSFCIIGILALFMSFLCVAVAAHTCRHIKDVPLFSLRKWGYF